MCIQGINYKTAKLIIDEYNISNLHDLVVIANTEDFTNIKGIGEKSKNKIMEVIL